MNKCTECGSCAINHHCHGRDGSDPELCDVCYWRVRATDYATLEAECARLKNSLLAITTRHFAEGWKKRTSDAELEQYLSAGIAQLEAERDKLAGLLREVKSAYTTATHWTDMRATMVKIDAALAELTP